jgi:transposase
MQRPIKTTQRVIIGIDTYKATHVAVAIAAQGTRLAALSIPTNPKGHIELARWWLSLRKVLAFGIKGTGFITHVKTRLATVLE